MSPYVVVHVPLKVGQFMSKLKLTPSQNGGVNFSITPLLRGFGLPASLIRLRGAKLHFSFKLLEKCNAKCIFLTKKTLQTTVLGYYCHKLPSSLATTTVWKSYVFTTNQHMGPGKHCQGLMERDNEPKVLKLCSIRHLSLGYSPANKMEIRTIYRNIQKLGTKRGKVCAVKKNGQKIELCIFSCLENPQHYTTIPSFFRAKVYM